MFNNNINASSSTNIQLGADDAIKIDSDGVKLNKDFYIKNVATINALSGYVGIGAIGDYLYSIRPDGSVPFIQQERIVFRTSNYTARAYDAIQADTTGGGFTITLPADPGANHPIKIISHIGGNILTIDGNGHNINVYDTNGNLVITDTAVTTTSNRQWTFRLTASGYQLNL